MDTGACRYLFPPHFPRKPLAVTYLKIALAYCLQWWAPEPEIKPHHAASEAKPRQERLIKIYKAYELERRTKVEEKDVSKSSGQNVLQHDHPCCLRLRNIMELFNPLTELICWKPQGPACRQNKALLELFDIFNCDAILARSEAAVFAMAA